MRRPVPKRIRTFAKTMRNDPTDAEAVMWDILRAKRLSGMRFRRQHPIGGYIVDFICLDEKLIIETDGSQHAENPNDIERDAVLRELGYTVLRLWNDEVLEQPDLIAQKILDVAGKPRR
ncbi:MAG: DUF559 domain-containing protein [Pseudomonadota bacterium]